MLHTQEDHDDAGIDRGDYVEVDIEERQIVLKPRKLIDPSQALFHRGGSVVIVKPPKAQTCHLSQLTLHFF